MKNNMGLILEGWRQTTLLEGVADLIKKKALDPEDIEEIGDKLTQNPDFKLAVQVFSALSQADIENLPPVKEGAMDWINAKIVKAMIAKDNFSELLRSDPRFAPLLKLTGPALALAFLYVKNESGLGIDAEDFTTAIDMIAKKGNIGLEGLADATLTEKLKRSPNG